MILYINACVREESRTERLAAVLLEKLAAEEIKEVKTAEMSFPAADESFLLHRDRCTETGDFNGPLFGHAKAFAAADTIVIAAPFWDLSFPASLRQYIEQINVNGITFTYDENGIPKGLCRAKKLWYVTTAGGPVFNDEYGFGYVSALAKGYWGIPETEQIKAEGLDIEGADIEAILHDAASQIKCG